MVISFVWLIWCVRSSSYAKPRRRIKKIIGIRIIHYNSLHKRWCSALSSKHCASIVQCHDSDWPLRGLTRLTSDTRVLVLGVRIGGLFPRGLKGEKNNSVLLFIYRVMFKLWLHESNETADSQGGAHITSSLASKFCGFNGPDWNLQTAIAWWRLPMILHQQQESGYCNVAHSILHFQKSRKTEKNLNPG